MLPEELLEKVKRIEIKTHKIVNEVMTGQYKSHFKGHGVQFSEHRLYNAGDDIRHIDWKASARVKEPLIKKYEEERELVVLLVVDISGSEKFGSKEKTKSEVAAEIAGMLAYAATHTGDKVGLLLFSDQVELILPPKKGRSHVLRIVRELLSFQPKHQGTRIADALDSARRLMKHSGIIFLISDFLDQDYELSLKRLARKNDVVAVHLKDEKEYALPALGLLPIFDPESGEESFVDLSSYRFSQWFERSRKELSERQLALFKGAGVELLEVFAQEDYGETVVRFFRSRGKRRV